MLHLEHKYKIEEKNDLMDLIDTKYPFLQVIMGVIVLKCFPEGEDGYIEVVMFKLAKHELNETCHLGRRESECNKLRQKEGLSESKVEEREGGEGKND